MSVLNSLKKIILVDQQDIFIACSYHPAKELCITLIDPDQDRAFSGHATDIDLRSQASAIRMIFNDFVTLMLKALTKHKADNDKFLYSLEENGDGFLFKWKSIDQEETIINIGSIKVTESDYSSVSKTTLCMLAEELSTLSEELMNSKQNVSNLKNELEEQLRLITDMGNIKERIEKELYSKFMLVLNEKKGEIRDLKRKRNEGTSSNGDRTITRTRKSTKTDQISNSSDEDACDRRILNTAGPSISKHNNSLKFFDDEELPVLVSPSKKRNRRKIAETKTTIVEEFEIASPVAMDSESEDELLKYM